MKQTEMKFKRTLLEIESPRHVTDRCKYSVTCIHVSRRDDEDLNTILLL